MGPHAHLIPAFVLALGALAGCGSHGPREHSGGNQDRPWLDSFNLGECTHGTEGKNPHFNLEPGYQIILASNAVQVAITVLDATEKVDGIETRVVEEREFENGQLKEVSRNFFTICREHHDVFYHGEDVDDYKDGRIVGHGGAWRAGVKGARAGLMMPAKTPVGLRHYQEVAPGVAMDRAEIVGDDVTLESPVGKFSRCLRIVETTPLEPGDKSIKLYAPGIGMVFDDDLVIVSHGHGKVPPDGPITLTVDVGGAYSEVEIPEAELPSPVVAVLKKLHPAGRIQEAKRETRKGGQIVYAIEVFVNGKQFDVEATPSGKVLRNEAD